jgi:hypothetical protein
MMDLISAARSPLHRLFRGKANHLAKQIRSGLFLTSTQVHPGADR